MKIFDFVKCKVFLVTPKLKATDLDHLTTPNLHNKMKRLKNVY